MTEKERAEKVFECFCGYLDGKGLKYKKDDFERSIILQITGEDFPITMLVKVEEENGRTFIFSKIPFEIRKEKLADIVLATTYINQVLAIGVFCVDLNDYYCSFESNEIFAGLDGFNFDYAERVIVGALSAVEKYNDMLFDINKGLMSVKEFAARL